MPLAVDIRPDSLETYIGQSHLVGEGKPLRTVIEQKHLFSMIFWGPPGVGKTTLARILAKSVDAEFIELSAVSAKKEDIRKLIEESENGKKVVLFLDEIHRFNKAQQDFLLPSVESGKLTLIGATTENPSFEVIAPLLSRCRVFVLNQLTEEEVGQVIDRAVKRVKATIDRESKEWLTKMANGDARAAITMIDNAFHLYKKLDIESLKNTLQSKHLRYDKLGEEHYNTISALIKSMRASDADASLYYLARMVSAGEDPLFIARRLVIFASEDIGIAQPTALVVANAVFTACQLIGYPECRENLAHGVVYLSQCKKDRRAYDGFMKALQDVELYGNLPIPLEIRNAPTDLMKTLDYGKGYHMYGSNSLLPDKIKEKKYLP